MSDRPIIFSAPMIQALLAGRKSQTRRLAKVKLHEGVNPNFSQLRAHREGDGWRIHGSQEASERFKVPYAVGDRLWVRENHAIVPRNAYRASEGVQQTRSPEDPDEAAIYAAGWERSKPRWRPSIHMPRWASRLTLTVTEVRVERLNDITEADAIAEGVDPVVDHGVGNKHLHGIAYQQLWDRLHGECAWLANPWVAAITFEVHRANIDALPITPVAPNLAQGGETPCR